MNEGNTDKVFIALNALRSQQPSGLLSIVATYAESYGVYTISLKHKFGLDTPPATFDVHTLREAQACVKFARKEAR